MPRDSSPPPPPPPSPSPTCLEIEPDEHLKAYLSDLHRDTERGIEDNSENQYGRVVRDDERSELDKSVEGSEDDDSEKGAEGEDDVTNSQQSHPQPPPRVSSTQPSHPRSFLPRRKHPSRWQPPPNFHLMEQNDSEDLNKSNLQRHGSRPYFSSEPPHQTFSGSLPPVSRPLLSAPEPSGISRTLGYATGQISSPVPSQIARHGSVRSTSLGADHHPSSASPHDKPNRSSPGEAALLPVSTSAGSQSIHRSQLFPEKTKQGIPIPSHVAGHGSLRITGSTGPHASHRYVTSSNSNPYRGDLQEQQTYNSASPLDKPNTISSLGNAVRFPVSASPGSQSIHCSQHFPEKTKQGIPIPSHIARHGSVRSTGSTGRSAGHRYVASPDSDPNRGLHEQQTPSSASPLDEPNLSSLSEAVRFPVSVSPVSQSIHGLQRFPDVSRQGIPIPRGPMPPEDIVNQDYDNWSTHSVPRIRIMRSRQNMDSEQVDVPWDIKEAQQIFQQTEHVEEGVWQVDSFDNVSEVGTQKEIEPNREIDGKQHKANVRSETREAEAKRIEAEAEKHEAEARTSEAESQARDAELQRREAEAQRRDATAKKREAEARTSEAEAQARNADAQARAAEAQTSEAEAEAREAAAKAKGAEAHRNWIELRQLEAEAETCSTALRMESVSDRKVADTMKRDADVQTREATVQTIEVDTQCKEELHPREREVVRLEEKAQQALAEAEQLEADARQAEASVKMRETAVQQKEAKATSREEEAKKLEADVQNREIMVRLREEEAGKMEDTVSCPEPAHRSSAEVDRLAACAH